MCNCKSNGFSLRHATQALLHDHAQRDFTYKIASKHLKAKTCSKAQTTKHQRVFLCFVNIHFLRSSPPAPIPSLPRRNGRSPLDPPRPCVAWRVKPPYNLRILRCIPAGMQSLIPLHTGTRNQYSQTLRFTYVSQK